MFSNDLFWLTKLLWFNYIEQKPRKWSHLKKLELVNVQHFFLNKSLIQVISDLKLKNYKLKFNFSTTDVRQCKEEIHILHINCP